MPLEIDSVLYREMNRAEMLRAQIETLMDEFLACLSVISSLETQLMVKEITPTIVPTMSVTIS